MMPLCRRLCLLITALCAIAVGPAERAAAQGTDQLFPDPMGFEQMSELLAPLELSEQQRQFIRAEHRNYLDQFRQLRENEINSYLNDIGTMALEYAEDRDTIVEGTKRIRAIHSRIQQIDDDFFARIRPILSEAQASQLQRLADRRARQRNASRHGSWDWSMPSLTNLDLARVLQRCDLSAEQTAAIDAALAAYELALTPIYERIHSTRLELPLAHHDRTAAARTAFEQRMADLESRLAATDAEEDRLRAERELQRLVREGDFWQPATSNTELDEAKAIREDIVRISRMNRQLLSELAATLEPSTMRTIERNYERHAFNMLRIPSDPLRSRVAQKMADANIADDLRQAIQTLYDNYTTDRRPLVHQLLSHAEDAQFLGTSRMWFPSNQQEGSTNPVDEDRQQIRDLNERTLQAYAALTGEEIPTNEGRRFALGDGPIIIETPEGDTASITVEGGGDGEEVAVAGVFIAAADADLAAGDNMVIFSTTEVEWAGAGDLTLEAHAAGPVAMNTPGGVRVARGWLPDAMTRTAVRDAALALGIADEQLPIVDAMYDEYRQSFDELDQSMLTPIKERLGSLSRPRDGDEVTDSDIDSAFAAVRSGMDALRSVDRNLFSNLAIVAGVKEEALPVQRAIRDRLRFAYRHLGQGAGAMTFIGSGVDSREHDVDIEQIVSMTIEASDYPDELRSVLDDYSEAAVSLMEARWQEELTAAAQQAKRMRMLTRNISTGADGATYSVAIAAPMPSAPDDADDAQQESDYLSLLRELNRTTLHNATDHLDEDAAHQAHTIYKRQAFASAYRDREALHHLFEKLDEVDIDATTRQRVNELKLEYNAEYNAMTDRMIDIMRRFADNGGGRTMSPMGPVDPSYFERMQEVRQQIEVERFSRRSLNQSTRQALFDLLDQPAREAIGLRDDS